MSATERTTIMDRPWHTQRMRTDESTYQSVYGDESGRFALLVGERGTVPPPYITGLVYLGDPADVVSRVVWAQTSARAQQEIADALGVTQQTVSRYVNGRSRPDLTTAGWKALVRLAFDHPHQNRQSR